MPQPAHQCPTMCATSGTSPFNTASKTVSLTWVQDIDTVDVLVKGVDSSSHVNPAPRGPWKVTEVSEHAE